ncbi:hypothetical protein ONZ45_g1902 [Pleurotus djamor]|nr:hypothetical protein ONZ45_g1902 [Pleurotus djamor]
MCTTENPGNPRPKAAKRPRLESPSGVVKGEKDPEFYFNDGSIVLSAHETARNEASQLFLFRVHMSLLAKTSTVFADMLGLPTPTKEDQDSYDGVPLVHLEDDADHIRGFLAIIYKTQYVVISTHSSSVHYNESCTRIMPKDRYSDDTIKSLLGPLIVSKKYEATDLKDHIISFIHDNWPQDYEEWKVVLKIIRNATDYEDHNPEVTIHLSWEADIRDEVKTPLAYAYHYLSFCHINTFKPDLLRSTDLLIVMQGHQLMRTWFYNSVVNWNPAPCSAQKCDVPRVKDALLLSLLKSDRCDSLGFWEGQADSTSLAGLCSARCRSKASTWLKGLVAEAYHKVPEFFSLSNWKADEEEE